ncbi:MAG: ABC transporter permease [Gemmatimonadaceae bacterium]
MWRLIARRLAQSVVVVFLVTTATFVLIRTAPGDAVAAKAATANMSAAVRQQMRDRLALDRPFAEQYAIYLGRVARGDFDYSLSSEEQVSTLLARAIPNTLILVGVALLAAFVLGVALGVVQASRQGGWFDRIATLAGVVFYSMPSFWLALVVMLLFAVHWGLFPTSAMCTAEFCGEPASLSSFGDLAKHLVLPAGTLALVLSAGIARYQRSAVLDTMHEDFIRTARAKGVGERAVLWHHILRNALLPVITLIGFALPALLGGAVFVEKIFAWPGMGELAVKAVSARDYPVVLAVAIVGSALVCVGSLVADLLTAWANPRARSS